MILRVVLCIIFAFSVTAQIFAAGMEDIEIKGKDISRVISTSVGFVKTAKIANGKTQMLLQTSPEFLIDIKNGEEYVSLVPSDFVIKSTSDKKEANLSQKVFQLTCQKTGYPLDVYIYYTFDPKANYIQKHLDIRPTKKISGAVLTRVVLESLSMRPEYQPIMPANALDNLETGEINKNDGKPFLPGGYSLFGGLEQSKDRGFFFAFTPKSDQYSYLYNDRRNEINVLEVMSVPLEDGYTTGRVTVSLATGNAEDIYKQYSDFMAATAYKSLNDTEEYKKIKAENPKCFESVKYIPVTNTLYVNAEARLEGDSGFLVLYNVTSEKQKATLLMDSRFTNIFSDIFLKDIAIIKSGDKIDIEVEPNSVKIIPISTVK